MRIKIKEQSSGFFAEYEGTVVEWTSGVEKFGGVYMQVPCVIIADSDGVAVINLQKENYWYEIEVVN